MPRQIQADGRTITVPDDATPDEINQIVGPAPTKTSTSTPPNSVLGGVLRRGGDILSGIGSTFFGPPQPDENILTATPIARMARGAYQSGKQALGQATQQAKDAYNLPPGTPVTKGLEYLRALTTGVSAFDPLASGTVANLNQLQDQGRTSEAVGQAIPDLAMLGLGTKQGGKLVSKPISAVAKKVTDYFPRSVEAAGENIPVLVGEANPESKAGRAQISEKRAGVGATRFKKVETAQQEAVKNVIRNTAQQTSEMMGPLQDEPGAAMQDAANATFEKARPMYAALDQSLTTVPDTLSGVSRIVQDAIGKARKLGVDIDSSAEDAISFDGRKLTPESNPELWQRLKDQGVINDAGQGTPLTAYTKIRSQLLKMQRSASDPAFRFAVGNEIQNMTGNMERALEGTPLHANWLEAGRLWAKGYALRDVADAIKDSTKGTPASAQAPELTPVPTTVQGAGLVSRINDLADNGTLQRAFKPEEIANLRKAADTLDRIQRTPIGQGSGESLSISRGVGQAVRGAAGPLVGAGLGALAGGLGGAEFGAGLGFIVQRIGERGLVNLMTRTDGVSALQAFEKAKNVADKAAAMQRIAAISAKVTPPSQ